MVANLTVQTLSSVDCHVTDGVFKKWREVEDRFFFIRVSFICKYITGTSFLEIYIESHWPITFDTEFNHTFNSKYRMGVLILMENNKTS